MKTFAKRSRGFSLIELVIVVVIIGIIAAIAIPHLSRGSAGAADSATAGNLAVLRSSIDLFATEHGGTYPSVGTFDSQLTQYTDSSGSFNATKTTTFVYGPYLRKVPPLPVGPVGYKGANTIVDGSSGTPGTTAGGWFFNPNTGDIKANLPDTVVDSANKSYNAY